MLEEKIKELEKLGKPIVFVKEICSFWSEEHQHYNIDFIITNHENTILTDYIYEKEGILITDDFIFIKD